MGRIVRGTLAALVVLVCIVIIIAAIATERAERSEPALLDVGTEGVINVANTGIGVTLEDHNAFLEAAAAPERGGVRDLRAAGKVFLLSKGTGVVVLEHLLSPDSWARSRVQVLDGEHAGETGWVTYDQISAGAP